MKRILSTFLFIFALSLFFNDAEAQCNQKLVYNCATNNNGAIYLRDFNAKLKKTKPGGEPQVAKFSVVLNKGTHYRFNLCNPPGFEGRSVLKLYDGNREWGSTFNEKTGKDYPFFDFICTKSAVYYVFISFKEGKDNKKGCAVGILSFVGKNK